MSDPYTFGYARVSTDDQDLTLQRAALVRYGIPADQIYDEHASGKSMKRKELARILKILRRDDTLVVWKLDRLGRTLTGVLEVLERLAQDGINFVSLTESFDTSTPMGKAFLQFAMVMAELERNLISERTRAGMAAAKAAGRSFGRPHFIRDFPKRMALLRRMDRAGELRDADGELIGSAARLMEKLNSADKRAPVIGNAETVRRFKREGFPGVDLDDDDSLDLDDE